MTDTPDRPGPAATRQSPPAPHDQPAPPEVRQLDLPPDVAVPLPMTMPTTMTTTTVPDPTAPTWVGELPVAFAADEQDVAPGPAVEPLETWLSRVGGVAPDDTEAPDGEAAAVAPADASPGPPVGVAPAEAPADAAPEPPADAAPGPPDVTPDVTPEVTADVTADAAPKGPADGIGIGIGGPVIAPVLVGAHRSHRQWQRALEVGQGARGTCWAFAGVAALEAAYARRGVSVDLSEQYLFHVMKAHEAHRNATAFTSLIGFMGASDIVKNMTYAAIPESRFAPYVDEAPLVTLARSIPGTGGMIGNTLPGTSTQAVQGTLEQSDWFEYDLRLIPLMARWFPQYRVRTFGTLGNYSVGDVKRVIDDGYDVVVDVFDQINNGGHCIVVLGYDDRTRTFEIKNSQSTVNGGFATMQYSGDPQFQLRNGAAYYVTDVWPVQTHWPALWVGRWEIDHDGWRGRLVIRRFCDLLSGQTEVGPGNRISMGTWYGEDGRQLDVVGHFVDGGRGLHCAVGGQPFELYLHTRDPYRASGRCLWNSTWFGVVLSRGTAVGAGVGFDRTESIGLWDTTHDGWRGQLRVGVDPSYVEGASATWRPARIDPSTVAHEVVTHVDFGGGDDQRFQLLVHTREDGLLGGVTQWGGRDWPVEGRMSRHMYAVHSDGTLWWYRHPGRFLLNADWEPPRQVGTGWSGLPAILGGGDGVVYVVRADGSLAWYFHEGRNQGTFSWRGPTVVGWGWDQFRSVFAGDGGVVYAVTTDGRLLWYRHLGRRDGSARWLGPVQVGTGWDQFRFLAAGPDGTIYAARPDGVLRWYRHYGHDWGYPIWHGPLDVGQGWTEFDAIWPVGHGFVYARIPRTLADTVVTGVGAVSTGVVLGRDADPAGQATEDVGVPAPAGPVVAEQLVAGAGERALGRPGDLLLYRHDGFLVGNQSWVSAGRVGTGWGWPIRAVFAT